MGAIVWYFYKYCWRSSKFRYNFILPVVVKTTLNYETRAELFTGESMTIQHSPTQGDVLGARRLIAFIGFALILLSLLLMSSAPMSDEIVFPPFSGLAAFGLIVFLASGAIKPNKFWARLSALGLFQERIFWLLFAATFSGIAAKGSTLFQVSYMPVTLIWLIGAASYLFVFMRGSVSWAAIGSRVREHRNEILIVVALMIVAGFLRFYDLGQSPRVLDGDEGLVGLSAQDTAAGRLSNPFELWENFGALYLQFINFAFGFFGVSPFALRFFPAIGGVLAVPSLYLFARQIGGRRIALLTGALLTMSHVHIHFSRIASVAYIQGVWLAPLELYFLLSGLEKRKPWRAALGGILLAIHFSVYLGAQVLAALVVVFMALAFLLNRAWFKEAYGAASAFWGGWLITIIPEAFYISQNIGEFMNRLSRDGTFQSGWLANTIRDTGRSAASILFERVVHAFMSLLYYPAFDFYGSPLPMLTMLTTFLFLIGLGVALLRVRSPKYLLLNGYFWSATLAIGIFAIPPSADSYRMLMALPAAFILAALGLDQILKRLGIGWDNAKTIYTVATSLILVGLLINNVWIYYGDFVGKCRFGGNLESRFASYLGTYVGGIESEASVYLLSDDVYFYGSHASTDFLSGRRELINVLAPAETLELVSGETVIATPKRIAELAAWARLHPGGKLHYRYDCDQAILLAYQIP